MKTCNVCGVDLTKANKPTDQSIFCSSCFNSGAHMSKMLEKGITLEYKDGSRETYRLDSNKR